MATLTLGERVTAALQGPPKRTQRALAAAVGITPVSVNDWVSGRTRTQLARPSAPNSPLIAGFFSSELAARLH